MTTENRIIILITWHCKDTGQNSMMNAEIKDISLWLVSTHEEIKTLFWQQWMLKDASLHGLECMTSLVDIMMNINGLMEARWRLAITKDGQAFHANTHAA